MAIVGAFMVPHPPLIVPEVGRGGEKQIEATANAYEKVAEMIAELQPETIILSSPHTGAYYSYIHISPGEEAHGSFASFGAPQVSITQKYDRELAETIEYLAVKKDFPAGTPGERLKDFDHGVMVPLYFIRKKWTDFRLVRTGISFLPLTEHYRFGQIIREAVDRLGRRAVYVASGDLSHRLKKDGPYGLSPEGPVYDERIMDVCGRGAFGELFDFDESFCDKAGECGHRSFVIMAGALDGVAVEAKALSHEGVTGVGYGICSFIPKGPDDTRHFREQYIQRMRAELKEKREKSDAYVRLARASVESFVRYGQKLSMPEDLPLELTYPRAGVFVSIHKYGKLRGCIGTIRPARECVAEEIIENAVSAASKDPRFDPITEDELEWLEISVDVLGVPEPIDSPEQLDVKRYGVIVSAGGRRGLLLPDLEGVDTVKQQIDIARRKADIPSGTNLKLERFEVIRHT